MAAGDLAAKAAKAGGNKAKAGGPAQAEKVFDAFHQVDASTTRQVGGTGLGLTISRRLCQLLGGDISVHSVPGQCSSFTIDLPARAGPQPHPAIA